MSTDLPNNFSRINYAIWSAVSTEAQAGDDKFSVQSQVEKSRAHAHAKGWVETAGPYVVPGESRTKYVNLSDAERAIPQLKQLLDDAQAGRYDVIVCAEYDRFRDLLDPIARTLAHYGVQMYSISQPIEPIPPELFNPYASDSEFIVRGMAQIISRAGVANLRRKYFSEMPKRVAIKGLPSGPLPWGYRKPLGRETDRSAIPEQVPEQVELLRMMADMLLHGASTYQIVAELERRGVPPPKRHLRRSDRGEWDATTVRRILSNPFYAGYVRWGVTQTQRDLRTGKSAKRPRNNKAEVIQTRGVHEPVWDDAMLAAIDAEFERRAPSHRGHITRQLTGLMHCSICDASLWRHSDGKKEKKYMTWRCSESYAAHMVHRNELLLGRLADGLIDAIKNQTVVVDEAPKDDLDELEARRKRIGDGYEAGLFDLAEFGRRVADIDARIRDVRAGRLAAHQRLTDASVRQQAIDLLLQLDQTVGIARWLQDDDPLAVNTTLHQVIEKIIVDKQGAMTIIPK